MGLSINEIAQSYEGGDIVPIYTAEQLEKVGTGETAYVAETGKIYTFEDDKSYLFYGQSEDLTKILNDLIDERLGTSSGTTTGTKTLLWETEITSSDYSEEEEINVENLSKYKQLFIECIDEYDKYILFDYVSIDYMKENIGYYILPGLTPNYLKYINENTLSIGNYGGKVSNPITYRIYGIE